MYFEPSLGSYGHGAIAHEVTETENTTSLPSDLRRNRFSEGRYTCAEDVLPTQILMART
jgi:hypothetical protein